LNELIQSKHGQKYFDSTIDDEKLVIASLDADD